MSMNGPNQGFAESVARFRAELAAAVTRSRRAAAEAHDQASSFHRETNDLSGALREGRAQVEPDELTDPAQRALAEGWRRDHGFAVDEFPPDEELVAAPAPPAPAPSGQDDDDEDFSQHRILFRG
ncbi:hypothetical protein [Actinokineospora sp.]|uniref:hypothetical protein n=1 Tax=Actinokineospora sp. TaxID=1872133 RepID=UPI0040383467